MLVVYDLLFYSDVFLVLVVELVVRWEFFFQSVRRIFSNIIYSIRIVIEKYKTKIIAVFGDCRVDGDLSDSDLSVPVFYYTLRGYDEGEVLG